MKLWLDADAAPRDVKEVCYRACERLKLETVLVANMRLQLPVGYPLLSAVRVEGGPDVADRYIEEHAESGDVAVTQDIPLAALLVPKDTPGLSFGVNEKKMGWNAQPTAIVQFDDCRVPVANLLGEEGAGFRYAMAGLDGGRLNIAACSLGGARLALETAQDYVATRKQFGRPIGEFQALQFRLADMATDLEAARLMVLRGAWAIDADYPEKTKWCAMAKRMATDACHQIADEALQLHGGYGYLKDYPLERIVRDLRVHRILEGTNEIMRDIVSRQIAGKR
jgi:alkylation response protein AidB-like acyl-CoA dehydrogenase